MERSIAGAVVPPLAAGTMGGEELAQVVAARCVAFLHPLLEDLDRRLDRRLVRTAAAAVVALVRHRNRPQALLLSELGAYVADPRHAPAGTKRLANLVHSPRWDATAVDTHLLRQGQALVEAEAARAPEGRALCILDGSVLEKPESASAQGLAPVRSGKARRLARPRPHLGTGYFAGPPGRPVVVPGFRWLSVLVTGWAPPHERRPLALGAWHWYTKPAATVAEAPAAVATVAEAPAGAEVPRQRDAEAQWAVLERVVAAWGADRLLHVWDRGLSGAGWLGGCLDAGWHFVVRWKKGNRLRPATARSVGNPVATPHSQDVDGVSAWRLTAGLRPWGECLVPNPRAPQRPLRVAYAARPVRLLHRDDPLWLVVARIRRAGTGDGGPRPSAAARRRGHEPWRLLTTEPVETSEQCRRIVEAYAARWQIEQSLRFGKSELGVESVRVRAWASRTKLLALAALAYAFLVHLLGASPPAPSSAATEPLLPALLRWAHRTGRQARDAWRSLYRLRAALAHLWNHHTPSLQAFT